MSEFHSEWGHGWQPAPHTNLNPKQFAPHIQYSVPTGDKPFGSDTTHFGHNIAGVTLESHAPDRDNNSSPETLGHLHWSSKTGEILDVRVNKDIKRKGAATAMYKAAKDVAKRTSTIAPRHSNDRTVEGTKWAESTGDRVPPLIEIKK
jgi:hypothetical protein